MLGLLVCLATAANATEAPLPDAVFSLPLGSGDLRRLTAAATEPLAKARVVRGQFIQRRYLRELPKPLESRGDFLYARGIGIVWHTLTPFDSRLAVTPTGIRQDNRGDSARLDVAEQPALRVLGRMFVGLFALDFEALARDFNTFGMSESDRWRVGLRPRRAALARVFNDAVLVGARSIELVMLHDAAGDRTDIQLQNLRYDADQLTPAEQSQF